MTRDEIRDSIIAEGGKEFLSCGFEKASLKNICKGANITTGAFYRRFKSKKELFEEIVSPTVKAMEEMIKENSGKSGLIEKILHNSLDYATLSKFYDDCHNLRLLLNCSDGTKYIDYPHMISQELTKATKNYIINLKGKSLIPDKELHMFMSAYISAIFEAVVHSYTEDEIKNFLDSINNFFNWEGILKLNKMEGKWNLY